MAPFTENVIEMPRFPGDPHELRTVPVLVVHAHSSCNCRCLMCDIWKDRSRESFHARDLQPHLESIRKLGVRWIVFSGGEPLMNPELPALSAMLRRENIRVTLLTTGLLLSKKADEVVANFDEVIVSLDGPRRIHDEIRRVTGAFGLLEDGVKALRHRCNDFRITARTVVQKSNHRYLRETARAAKSLGLDAISFLAADLTSTAFNRPIVWPVIRQEEVGLNLLELGVLETEIDLLICDPEHEFAGFVVETAEKLHRITRHFRAQLGLKSPESPPCNAPWVSAVIETDGTVRPCFFHKAIGNLHQHSLKTIMNGRVAREFRASLDIPNDPICRRCVCSLHYRP